MFPNLSEDSRTASPSFSGWSKRASVGPPAKSSPELLALHAVRLKGMADDADVAARFGLDVTLARELLLDFQAFGWITRVEFVGTAGWTLTESGRSENERQLAHELAATDSNPSIRQAFLTFLPYNDRLLRACTDWQLRPTGGDPLAVNDHTDQEWDQRVLSTLSTLSEELRPICQELGDRLARFQGTTTASWPPFLEPARASSPGLPAQEWIPATRCGWNSTRT
jgi:hypothetical protein